jgi:hypothetical protein
MKQNRKIIKIIIIRRSMFTMDTLIKRTQQGEKIPIAEAKPTVSKPHNPENPGITDTRQRRV